MAGIRFESFRFIQTDGGGGILQALENDGAGTGSAISPPAGYFDAELVGIPASIPVAVVESALKLSDTIVITDQVLAEGFGSYLADILPNDIAVTAGAFGASMQQVKNITQIPIEKFAQVVASMETIQGLDLINGTNVPTDVSEAQAAYELVALGTGPYKTFTYSDFYGCMSGLPYNWPQLQTAITDLQTPALVTIYENLYNATQGSNPGLDAAIQAQIELANDEIASIRTLRPGASVDLNDLYNTFAVQLGNEQRARNTGLSPLPDPRDPYINKFPITIYSFVDSLPLYGKQTQPHMAAQTLEAISDLTFVAGQSIIGAMRQARNQDRLDYVGVSLDDNIPDFIEEQKEWIGNGVLANSVPAFPNNTLPAGYYDPVDQNYYVSNSPGITGNPIVPGTIGSPLLPGTIGSNIGSTIGSPLTGSPFVPVDTGGPKVPGSLAKSPYQTLIPPQLNTLFTSDVLLPAQYSVPEAIEQVIDCNCDCWL
jgi:hypothetical protein